MYPEITPLIRKAIKRRYQLIPYIYSLLLEAHQNGTPPQRWVGWNHEDDPEIWTSKLKSGESQYWLGDSLLVGGVFESGVDTTKIYLPNAPRSFGYMNMNEPHQHFTPGQWVDIETDWEKSIPLLAKIGSAIPIGKDVQTLPPGEDRNPGNLPLDDYRAVEIYPPKGDNPSRTFSTTWYEDDGISATSSISSFDVEYTCRQSRVWVRYEDELQPKFMPLWTDLIVIMPPGDRRVVVNEQGRPLEQVMNEDGLEPDEDERRQYVYIINRD
jgi:alpha-glucosidase (family GH31 glycosyl hydrolase)